jgi:DNA-directed RNA polymerase subunit RPC12/RpoP
MTTRKKPPQTTAAAGDKTYICYGCGKKIRTAEEIIENELAEYCETCYRDRYFYHTTNGGKGLERNRC